MSFEIERHDVPSPSGSRPVLVVSPTEEVLIERERLEHMESGLDPNEIDSQIVELVKRQRAGDSVLLFRSANEERGARWGHSPELSEDESRRLGYQLVRAQLATYRRLAELGVFALLSIELGIPELDGFKWGTDRRLRELEADADAADDPDRILDLWILRHMTFYFALSLDKVLESVLPAQLGLLEQRIPRLRALLSQSRSRVG